MEKPDPFAFLEQPSAAAPSQQPAALSPPSPPSPAAGGSERKDDPFAFLDEPTSAAPASVTAPSGGGSALESFGSRYLSVPTLGGARSLRAGLGVAAGDLREKVGLQRGNLGRTFPEEYQRVERKEEAAQTAHPTVAKIGTTAGVGAALIPAGRVTTALATLPGAVTAGGITGGLDSYGKTGDAKQAAVGAAAGAVGGAGGNLLGRMLAPAVTATGRALGFISPAAATRTAAELRKEAGGYYDAADKMGVVIDPLGAKMIHNDALTRLRANTSYSDKAFPKVAAVLKELEGMSVPGATGQAQVTSLRELENIRQRVNNTLLSDADKATRTMGYSIRAALDNAYGNIGSYSSHANSSETAAFIQKARPLWMQAQKADDIADAIARATRRAQSTYSGGNWNNAVRQELRRVFEKELKHSSHRYTPDELAQMELAMEGTTLANTARKVGKVLSPTSLTGGIGAGSALVAGLASGHPLLPALAVGAAGTGALAKYAGEKLTAAETRELQRMIASTGRKEIPQVLGQSVSELSGRIGTIAGAPSINERLPPVKRASGGRIERRDYPAKRMTKIERLAMRARGGIADELVPVMDMPDDVVADALALAK